jgi:hypothetical protein
MKALFLAVLISVSFVSFSQSCAVSVETLSGTYEGDCKKNKADGKGTATGEDTYTGDFKSGYPDGKGKYVWKNGDWYEGEWKKGMREGQGAMHYINVKTNDSLISGFWKKDKYIGKYEKPYIVHNKTPDITRTDVTLNKETALNEIAFSIETVSGGAPIGVVSGNIIPKVIITDISIISGQYMNKVDNNNLPKTFISTLKDVQFPFRARISMGSDQLEIEFFEKGSYKVEIKILK